MDTAGAAVVALAPAVVELVFGDDELLQATRAMAAPTATATTGARLSEVCISFPFVR
jgi:hypothetical protein